MISIVTSSNINNTRMSYSAITAAGLNRASTGRPSHRKSEPVPTPDKKPMKKFRITLSNSKESNAIQPILARLVAEKKLTD